jgi:hypothetical protein
MMPKLFDRVEIPSYEPNWKRGDRFGMVVRIPKRRGSHGMLHYQRGRVKMDSGDTIMTHIEECRVLEETG